jgi:hypothetical protein
MVKKDIKVDTRRWKDRPCHGLAELIWWKGYGAKRAMLVLSYYLTSNDTVDPY